jgi:hypothetical protein
MRKGSPAGMGLLPLGLQAGQVAFDLGGALAHRTVERRKLRNLPTHGIESQAVLVEHVCELRVGCDNGGAERADRLFLSLAARVSARPIAMSMIVSSWPPT